MQFKTSKKVKKALVASYYKTRQYQKSIQVFEELLEEDNDNLFIQFQLAKLYFNTNDLKKSTAAFQRLLKKDKDFTTFVVNRMKEIKKELFIKAERVQ